MFSDDLWGILILAATQKRSIDESGFDQLNIKRDLQFSADLRQIANYCRENSLPDLTLIAHNHNAQVVFAHDWSNESIPDNPHIVANHSLGWFEDAMSSVRRGREAARDAANDLIQKQWPLIAKIVRERLAPLPSTLLSDKERVEHLARMIYPLLPTAVQFLVREQDFVNICLSNAQLLLEMYRRGQPSIKHADTSSDG